MSDIQIYDKAKWHYEGEDYPAELPESHAYTHGGFVLAWLIDKKLVSPVFLKDHKDQIAQFTNGKISAGRLSELTDGVLDSEMLTDAGNSFAEYYIDESFLEDYEMLFEDDFEQIYEVEDTQQNLAKVARMLNEAFSDWQSEEGNE